MRTSFAIVLGVTLLLLVAVGASARQATNGTCGAATGTATDVTKTSATLNGTLGANGGDAMFCGLPWFDYGPTASYGLQAYPVSGEYAGPDVPVSVPITGLSPNTTYHFRLETTNGAANVGSDVTFTTLGAPPPPPPPPPPPSKADVGIANSVSPATLPGPGNATFTLVATNNGPDNSSGTVVTNGLPAGSTLVSVATTKGSCSGLVTVTCVLGALAPAESETVTIVVAISVSGSVADTATVSSDNGVAGAGDTTATSTVVVSSPATTTTTTSATSTTTTSAPPPPAPSNTVVPNHSIGPISIGTTEPQVVALLGPPASTLTVSIGNGQTGHSVEYRFHGAPLLITYDSTGHVVSIETYSPYFRTGTGVGPGSLLSLIATLNGFRPDYCELGYWNGTATTPPNHVVTVFTPNGGTVASILITELRLYTACATGSHEPPPPLKDATVFDRALAGVSIGMSESRVVALFGKPLSTLTISLGGGSKGHSVRYRVHGAPLLITYDSTGRVVSLETYSPFFRTIGGLGPGSPLTLVQALHGFRPDYCELGWWNGTARTPPGQVVTVFTPNGGVVASVLITQLRLYTACAAGSKELPPST